MTLGLVPARGRTFLYFTNMLLTTGRFGFAKFCDPQDSEICIRGFHKLGYEVGFARVSEELPFHSHTVYICLIIGCLGIL